MNAEIPGRMAEFLEKVSAGRLGSAPGQPRVLVVCEDGVVSRQLMDTFSNAGFSARLATSMKAACEAARSGWFQVVITAPVLRDGSWRRLADIASRDEPGFVIILLATETDAEDWAEAVEIGVFDILDAQQDLPKATQAAKRAGWAAYLKGGHARREQGHSPRAA